MGSLVVLPLGWAWVLWATVAAVPVLKARTHLPVLVVDDNRTNRRILHDLLTNWGMQPSLAASGPAALEQFEAAAARGTPFRVALLDVMMPDMDGFMLAERIRGRPELDDCILIVLSSAGQTENEVRRQELRIAHYLIKPVKHSDLRDVMIRTLSAREQPLGPSAVTPAQAAEGRRSLRILLAEDNPLSQVVGREMLAQMGCDASLVEINPLIITAEDDVIALDGKMDFDDNALYRHPDVKEYRDLDEEDPTEVEAEVTRTLVESLAGGFDVEDEDTQV